MTSRLITVALATTCFATAALAVEFTVTGNAQAGFNAQSMLPGNALLGLTYAGSTFNNTSINGFMAFGGNPLPVNNVNNFGSLFLPGTVGSFNGNTFTLGVTFTAPTGIAGGGSASFVASVVGQVVNNNTGGVNVSFGANGNQTFTWANASTTGSFTLYLNNVAIAPNQSASLTGYILGQATPVPEPMTLAGLAVGAIALIRRRRAR